MRIIHCPLHLCTLFACQRALFSLCGPSPMTADIRVCKPLPQFFWRFPNNVIVLACIEMDIVVV